MKISMHCHNVIIWDNMVGCSSTESGARSKSNHRETNVGNVQLRDQRTDGFVISLQTRQFVVTAEKPVKLRFPHY